MSAHTRRRFLQTISGAAFAPAIVPGLASFPQDTGEGGGEAAPLYHISLAQWSLHRKLFAGDIDALDFPKVAKDEFDIDAVEYVNQFFKDKARDEEYLGKLRDNCEDAGVRSLLIMCDGEGAIGDPDDDKRKQAVENHHKWVDAAKFLGCHSIRVNAQSSGTYDEQMGYAADGLWRLTDYAAPKGVNVLVENHGGLSSNGQWLARVIRRVGRPECGTLPDFGNFRISKERTYDRYRGVKELMPFAKAVSAKSHDFDEDGEEIHTDYERMMRIVIDAGYHGHVGIEYEGSRLDEYEGIRATNRLLERVRERLASE